MTQAGDCAKDHWRPHLGALPRFGFLMGARRGVAPEIPVCIHGKRCSPNSKHSLLCRRFGIPPVPVSSIGWD